MAGLRPSIQDQASGAHMFQDVYQPGDPVADFLFNWLPVVGVASVGVLGIALLIIGFRKFVKAMALKKWGAEGRAVITGKWLKEGFVRREERHRTAPLKYHYLRFQREEKGRMVSAQEVAPLDIWQACEPGDTVDVVYLPRGSLMRLANWPYKLAAGAGMAQLAIGALMTSASASMIIAGAFSAMNGPNYAEMTPDWSAERAEVLWIGDPADPYLRIFAPGKKYLQVVFGDTNGGAFMANQRLVLMSPEQLEGLDISEGTILKAWMDPLDEYNAILELERKRDWR